MKSYRILRPNFQVGVAVELSFSDMIRLLFGRELYLMERGKQNEQIILRQPLAYQVFNMKAPLQ